MSPDLSPEAVGSGATLSEPPNDGRHSLLRNLVAMTSSQVVSWGLGFVAQIIQPRFLGPDGLGQIQLAFSLWIVAQVFVSMGTGVYLTLEMARNRERGATLVGPIILLRVGAFLASSIAMVTYTMIVGFDREMMVLIAITGVTMLFNSAQDVFVSAIIGLEQMGYVSVATVASKLIYTGVMVVVLVSGGGVVGLAWATTFNAVLLTGIMLYFYRRLETLTFTRPTDGYLAILRSSVGFMTNAIVLTLYMQVDMVVMSLLVDDDALGWYTSADVLVSSLLFVPGMILVVLFPMMGRLFTTDVDAAMPIVHRAFWVLVMIGVSGGFGLAVIAEHFAVLLFGEDFREAGEVLSVFAVTLPLIFVTMLLGQVSLASGRERFWNRIMAAAVVMSVAFDIVFVPILDRATGNGAVAGALGYLVTESFMVVIAVRRLAPELLSAATAIKLAKIITAGGLMFVASWQFRDLFLAIPVAVGAVTFVASVVVFRVLSDDDRYLLQTLASRAGIPLGRRGAAPAADDVVDGHLDGDHDSADRPDA